MIEARPFSGEIYAHINTVNGKIYVGQTTAGMIERWRLHQRCANSPSTPAYNGVFARAIRKYGADAFVHQVLSIARSQAELDNLEKVWIILLQSKVPNGYNLSDGGYAAAGHVVSPDVRARLSAASKEQWQRQHADPDFKLQYRTNRKNWTPSVSHIAAVVAAHLGKKQSVDTIARRVAKTTGMKRSPEARARMSASHIGRPWTESQRQSRERGRKNVTQTESIGPSA
jgi:group I intron endonuclease